MDEQNIHYVLSCSSYYSYTIHLIYFITSSNKHVYLKFAVSINRSFKELRDLKISSSLFHYWEHFMETDQSIVAPNEKGISICWCDSILLWRSHPTTSSWVVAISVCWYFKSVPTVSVTFITVTFDVLWSFSICTFSNFLSDLIEQSIA